MGDDSELQVLKDTACTDITKGKNGRQCRAKLKRQESVKVAKSALRGFLETSTIRGVGKVRDKLY